MSDNADSAAKTSSTEAPVGRLAPDSLPITPQVLIRKQRFKIAEIAELAVGEALAVDPVADRQLELWAGGQLIARGRIVTEGGEAHFHVEELVFDEYDLGAEDPS